MWYVLNFPQLLRSNHNIADQSNSLDQTNSSRLRGRSDRWPKGWMGLAARPLHAGRKTRPLRRQRERERRKKDRKWGLRVTQRDRTAFKKMQNLPLAHFRRETHSNCGGESAKSRYTKVIWTECKEDICHSLCVKLLSAHMLPALITKRTFKPLMQEASKPKAQVGTMLAQQAESHVLSLQHWTWSGLWPLGLPHIILPFPLFLLLYAVFFNLLPEFRVMMEWSISEKLIPTCCSLHEACRKSITWLFRKWNDGA